MSYARPGADMIHCVMTATDPSESDGDRWRIRDQATDLTRERIVDAAISEFAARGVRQTSMEHVALAAGLARSGVYRYFPSRPELIQAALMQQLSRFLVEFDRATQHLPDVADIAVEGFAFVVSFGRRNPLLAGVLTGDSDELMPYLAAHEASMIDIGRQFVTARLDRVVADHVPAELKQQLAETAARLTHSFLVNQQSVVDLDDPRAVREYARAFLAPLAAGLTGHDR